MSEMVVTGVLIALLAAGLVVPIRRDLQRAVQRRRLRAWLRTPQVAEVAERFAAMQRQIGEALLPSMREAAAAMVRFAQAVSREGRP